MATFQSQNFSFTPLSSSSKPRLTHKQIINYSSKTSIKSALQFPDFTRSSTSYTLPKPRFVLDEINQFISTKRLNDDDDNNDDVVVSKMEAILEAISDRIEMHKNIKEQRDNWATLLLNSTNMITLTATLSAMLASSSPGFQLTSFILFSSAAVIMAIVNKIQPCQLVQEQRNSIRQFIQLKTQIENRVQSSRITDTDVEDAIERVLTIDRAYPLPLLGAMLEKFPESFTPARWWPEAVPRQRRTWSKEMEEEMKEVMKVVKEKDLEDYGRLGSKALKISKVLAVAGPLLTGMAAVGTALSMPVAAGVCGALATVANTVEHGGQVGMVFEMYRNCAGFFKELEDDVGEGGDVEEEVFELKMALRLGRSVAELRDLAAKSRRRGSVNEFASKLF